MKNCLIVLGIIFVAYLAITDTMKRFEELDNISVTTPSQIEMKGDMFKSNGQGIKNSLNKNENKPQNPLMQKQKTDVIKEQVQNMPQGVKEKYNYTPQKQ